MISVRFSAFQNIFSLIVVHVSFVKSLKMAKIKAFDGSPCSLLATGIGIVELWYGLLKKNKNHKINV